MTSSWTAIVVPTQAVVYIRVTMGIAVYSFKMSAAAILLL